MKLKFVFLSNIGNIIHIDSTAAVRATAITRTFARKLATFVCCCIKKKKKITKKKGKFLEFFF